MRKVEIDLRDTNAMVASENGVKIYADRASGSRNPTNRFYDKYLLSNVARFEET